MNLEVKKQRRSLVSTSHMSRRQKYPDEQIDFKLYIKPLEKSIPQWNDSASTWRHSTHQHSFPKSKRFSQQKSSHLDMIKLQNPSTLSQIACTFGKGNKVPISIITLRNAKAKPSPDQYSMINYDEQTRNKEKGQTIAKGRQYYKKKYNPIRKDPYNDLFTIDNPASIYNVRKEPGIDAVKIKLHQRLKLYTQKMTSLKSHVPGPSHVVSDRHLYQMNGLNQRSFGVGQRIDLAKPANDNPGPKYKIVRLYDSLKTIL